MPPSAQRIIITVRDKPANAVEQFSCDLSLLRCTMTYFEPLIQRQLAEQQTLGKSHAPAPAADTSKGGSSASAPIHPRSSSAPDDSFVALRVNCDIVIFKWLLSWMESAVKPRLTSANAVSVLLSSSFLGMRVLSEAALQFVRDHLAEVLLSGVDMGCVPGDLLGRLCAVTTEAHIANCLHSLHQQKEGAHPNRAFVSALLRHWAADRLLLLPCVGSAAAAEVDSVNNESSASVLAGSRTKGSRRASASNASANGSGDPFASVPPQWPRHAASDAVAVCGSKDPTAAEDNGLRWCRLCGVLYDERELRRLLQNASSCLTSPQTTKPPLCSGCASSGGRTGGRIGSRGEKFVTHAPSRVLPASTPSLVSADAADVDPQRLSPLTVPPYTGNSQRQGLAVEAWAWSLIGATRFVVCRRCRRMLPLIDMPAHSCSANSVRPDFVPAERALPAAGATPTSTPTAAGASGASDVQSLIRWFDYAAREGVYAEVGGLRCAHCPPHASRFVEPEAISAPACSAAAGAAGAATGGEAAPPDAAGADAAATVATADTAPCAWVDLPHAVREETAVAPPLSTAASAARPVTSSRPGCAVDVDVENYYERQFVGNLVARLDGMRRAAPGKQAGSGCPALCSVPWVPPPAPPQTSSASSTRPQTSSGIGGGSLVLGSTGRLSKPTLARKSRRTMATSK